MPAHYFYGHNTYQARQAIEKLALATGATVQWLDKEDFQQRGVADWFDQQAGLFGTQLPVVRDVSRLGATIKEDIAAYLTQHPASEVVLWDRELPRPSAFTKRLPNPQKFSYPTPPEAVAWVQATMLKDGGTVTAEAAALLVDRAGVDYWQLQSILEKIVLTRATVTAEAVEEETQVRSEAEIFATLTAIINKQKQQAIASITTLLQQGSSELYVVSMLAWQFKVLTQVKQGSERGLSPEAISERYALKPFVVKKSLTQIRQVSADKLLETLTKILATDLAIKQGKVDPKTGLFMVVLSLLR